jgi:hypothetical protein
MLANDVGHACLGFVSLGLCEYDPAKPYTIYFALGAAVGALAFTLAVQQLLKPVHRFRLAARHLTLIRIYLCVFSGLSAVVVAALLPNLTRLHYGPWGGDQEARQKARGQRQAGRFQGTAPDGATRTYPNTAFWHSRRA